MTTLPRETVVGLARSSFERARKTVSQKVGRRWHADLKREDERSDPGWTNWAEEVEEVHA